MMAALIHQYVDEVAERVPQQPAVHFLEQTLSYENLANESNRLAHALIEYGVRSGDRVGIYMDKSVRTPVALYGIMKAGAAYVPIDPATSVQRVAALTRDCGIRHLVSAPSMRRGLVKLGEANSAIEIVFGLDSQTDIPFQRVSQNEIDQAPGKCAPEVQIEPSDLAYIMYTSGSTGVPKGIMHTHASGLSFARWAVAEYGLIDQDRLSNHAPLHFDLSIFDYFAAIVAGASTVIIPEDYTRLPASYSKLLAEQNVSVLFTVPFALIQMLLRGSLEDRDMSRLRWAIFGGEPFPVGYLRELRKQLPHVRFDNMYGPAEVNGCTHFTVVTLNENDTTIPIGPIAECAEALVVDGNDEPVKPGTTGELLVCTPTMMKGYWKRDDLDAVAFSHRVSAEGVSKVFYRTGDLVEEDKDGIFSFIGRKDRQVKVRGYRIELDEIEQALTAVQAVEEAAVYTIDNEEGSQDIYAQVTLCDDVTTTGGDLVRGLKKVLPWYAVPHFVSIADQFPRTATGKIDRRRLFEQATSDSARSRRSSTQYSN